MKPIELQKEIYEREETVSRLKSIIDNFNELIESKETKAAEIDKEIKKVLQQHEELTFDFHEVPEATEYRDSLLLAKEEN